VLFYRPRGMIYNAWFMGVSTISLDKASTRRLMSSLHRKVHMSTGARQHGHFAMAAMWSHGGGGRANPCPCINAHT
jgi:hypothetical protein